MNPTQQPHASVPDAITVAPNLTLYLHRWTGPDPRGTILMVHGKGDYGYGFRELGSVLQQQRWNCIAPDLRGFGRSPGIRCWMWRYFQYLQDLESLGQQLHPQVLCGYSAGSNWCVHYALEHPNDIKGLVLLSPAFRIDSHFSPPTFVLLHVLDLVWPQFVLYSRYNPTKVTSLPEQQALMAADPDITGITRVRFVAELYRSGQVCLQQAHQLKIPVLILYSPKDRVVNPQGAVDFYEALKKGSADATLVSLPESEHDLMHDVAAPVVQQTIQEWLAAHFN